MTICSLDIFLFLLEPVCCSMPSSNCCFLTLIWTDFPRGRLGGLVFPSLSELSRVCYDPHKGFGIVNKAEVNVFLELSCFFDNPTDVGSLITGSSAFSKTSSNIWKFTVHVLLKPGLEHFEHYFTSVWDECSCAVVWAFFGFAFLVCQNLRQHHQQVQEPVGFIWKRWGIGCLAFQDPGITGVPSMTLLSITHPVGVGVELPSWC